MSYILSILAAALAASVVELLAPKGTGGKLAASVRMTAGLFLLVALLSPLRVGLDLLAGLSDGTLDLPDYDAPAYESTLQASLIALGEDALIEWAQSVLQADFSIPPDRVAVIPLWDDTGEIPPPLAELCLVFSHEAMTENPHPIEEYFAAALGVPCRVSVAAP